MCAKGIDPTLLSFRYTVLNSVIDGAVQAHQAFGRPGALIVGSVKVGLGLLCMYTLYKCFINIGKDVSGTSDSQGFMNAAKMCVGRGQEGGMSQAGQEGMV